MKIAIYGGAFNPIGRHHIKIANEIINTGIIDEVWIMPCYKSMSGKKLEDSDHRLNLCQIAININNNNKIKLCNFEIKNQLVGQSYDIIKKFYENYSTKNKFYFLIGADNAVNIERWNNYEKLLQIIPFIVIPRKDYNIHHDAWCYKEPHIYLNNCFTDNTSSTEIRNELKITKYSDLIFDEMNEYIKKYNLYIGN